MALSQGLVQKLSTNLAMTPQLQQAIRLLQLSTVELEQEIQKAVEENPLLEFDDDNQELAQNNLEKNVQSGDDYSFTGDNSTDSSDLQVNDSLTALESSNLPQENDAPLDTSWENTNWEEGLSSSHRVSSSLMDDSEFDYQGEHVSARICAVNEINTKVIADLALLSAEDNIEEKEFARHVKLHFNEEE